MDTATEDALTQAIKQANTELVWLALELCQPDVAHLRLAQDLTDEATRLAVCRALVRRGLNPNEGCPSPIELACGRGHEHDAWSMAAAWQEVESRVRET